MKLVKIAAISLMAPLVCERAYNVTGDLFWVLIGYGVIFTCIVVFLKEEA